MLTLILNEGKYAVVDVEKNLNVVHNEKITDKQVKKYYNSIKRKLITDRAAKKKILQEISSNIDEYRKEYPSVGITAIIDYFGTAKEIANEYTLEYPDEVAKQRKLRKAARVILITILAIVFALVAIRTVVEIKKSIESRDGYSITYFEDESMPS